MSISAELRDKIERISNLPTLPRIASRLLHMVNDPATSAADVARIVEQDISLSAKIIRLGLASPCCPGWRMTSWATRLGCRPWRLP